MIFILFMDVINSTGGHDLYEEKYLSILVASWMLTASVYSADAAVINTTTGTIGGVYDITNRGANFLEAHSDASFTATGDVVFKNGTKQKSGSRTFYSFVTTTHDNNVDATIDMAGYNLTVGDYGHFLHSGVALYSNNSISITNAKNINVTHNGNGVSAQSNANVSIQAQEDINISSKGSDSAALVYSGSNSHVTFDAGHDIAIYSDGVSRIYAGNSSTFSFNAGNDITANFVGSASRPTFYTDSLGQGSIVAGNDIVVSNTITTLFADTESLLTVNAGNTISLSSQVDETTESTNGAEITLTAPNGITVSNDSVTAMLSTGTDALTTVNGDITISSPTIAANAATGGTITFNNALESTVAPTALQASDGGTINAVSTTADKTITGNIISNGGAVNVNFDTANSYLQGMTSVTDTSVSGTDYTGTLALTFNNGAMWNVTDSSSLTNLTNNSTIDMTYTGTTGESITTKQMSGTGTVKMNLDWDSNQGVKEATANSDYIRVTESGSGTQSIDVDASAMHLENMNVNDRLYVASVANGGLTFTNPITYKKGVSGNLYDVVFGLTNEVNGTDTDWFWGATYKQESAIVPAIKRANYAVYDLGSEMEPLHKRLGEIRYIPGEDKGLWARTNHTRIQRDGYYRQGSMIQIGRDVNDIRKDGGIKHQGFAIDYDRSRVSMNSSAVGEGFVTASTRGHMKRYGLTVYDTWMGTKGHYFDMVGKIGRIGMDYKTPLVDGSTSEASFGTLYQSISGEWGRQIDLDNGWYVEPQGQLQYTHFNGTSYTTSDGVYVHNDTMNSLIGRVGFRLGRHISDNTQWYVKANLLHEFNGDRGVNMMSVDGSESIESQARNHETWGTVGFGVNATFKDNQTLWLDATRFVGSDYGASWQISGGTTWKF